MDTRAKEIKKEILDVKNRLNQLVAERNKLIRDRYVELYNINTFSQLKVGHVYNTISKEFELSEPTVKSIILNKEDREL